MHKPLSTNEKLAITANLAILRSKIEKTAEAFRSKSLTVTLLMCGKNHECRDFTHAINLTTQDSELIDMLNNYCTRLIGQRNQLQTMLDNGTALADPAAA